ncbi:unnamed protein product [Closterium sp. NIES-53]
MAAQELRWLSYQLTDQGEPPRSPPVLYVDNKAMLALCWEHRLEHRTKHIALRYFLARELQQRGQLRLAYVASEANTADIFTKALPPGDHQRFCTMLACFALLDWSCDLLFSPTLPMGVFLLVPNSFASSIIPNSFTDGAVSLGGAGVTTRVGGTGGAGAAGPGGACTRGTGVARAGGVGGTGARDLGAGDPGAGGSRGGDTGAGGTGARGVGVGGAGAVDPGARGAGAGGVGAGGTSAGGIVQRRPFFVSPPPSSLPPTDSVLCHVLCLPSSTSLPSSLLSPPPHQSQPQLQPGSPLPAPSPYAKQTESFAERREPEPHPALPVPATRTGRRVPRPRPPPVPGTHIMVLRPSSVPLRVPLPPPPASSLLAVPDPESDLARATSLTVPRLLATVVIDPLFESIAASSLVAELVDFSAAYRLDYATSLVAESQSECPPSVGGECAIGTDVLEDKQEDLEASCYTSSRGHVACT